MILRSPYLSRRPPIFKMMTGLTVALFDELVWDVRPALAAARDARPDRAQRQRAVGGGRRCALPEREEILLTVIWLRQSGVLERLPAAGDGDTALLGDQAYHGLGRRPDGTPGVDTPRRKPRDKPRPRADVAFNRAVARGRIGVEHTIRDLRPFPALTLPDRRRRGQEARVCAVVELRARRWA